MAQVNLDEPTIRSLQSSKRDIVLAPDIGTDAWHAWRRAGIGSSDAAAACGRSPYRTRHSLWLEKVGLIPPAEETEEMEWGHHLESVVADVFEQKTGLYVVNRQGMLQHPARPWQRSTIDGEVVEHPDDQEAVSLYEGKCTDNRDGSWNQGVPEHIQIQVQHQMMVAGIDHAKVVVLYHGNRLRWYDIPADPRAQRAILTLEQSFWRRVQENDPPPADGYASTSADLRVAYADAVEDEIELSTHYVELQAEYRRAQQAVEDAKAWCERIKQEFMTALRTHTAAVGPDGTTIVTWKPYEKHQVDHDAVREEAPDLVARHTSVVRERRLTIKKPRDAA